MSTNAVLAVKIADSLSRLGSKPALVVNEDPLMATDIIRRVVEVQQAFRSVGVTAQDRVLVIGTPSLDYYAVLLAGVFGSCTASLVNPAQPDRVIQRLRQLVQPSVEVWLNPGDNGAQGSLLSSHAMTAAQAELSIEPNPVCFMSLSSGSLGYPTQTEVDAQGLAVNLEWIEDEFDFRPDDRWFEGSEPSSDLAITNTLAAMACGVTLVVPSGATRRYPAALACQASATIIRSPPSVVRLLARDARRRGMAISTLRILGFGGDLLPAGLCGAVARDLNCAPRGLNTYGKSEIAGVVTRHWFDPKVSARQSSPHEAEPIGDTVPGSQMHVVPRDVREPDVGEAVITSRGVGVRIVRHGPNADREVVLVKEPGEIATLRTEDEVVRRSDGLFFAGRLDRRVKMNGELVNLETLDAVLREVLNCDSCAVIGQRGELVAVISPTRSSTEDAYRSAWDNHIPPHLVPQRFVECDNLPQTASGKVDVSACTALATGQTSRGERRRWAD